MFVSTTQYVYNSPPTHSIKQSSIHQPNSTDVVIITPGTLGRWSHNAQELQKQVHDKAVKPRSYASDDKVWLNSKYIKTKENCKLEAKFFGPFRVLHLVGN